MLHWLIYSMIILGAFAVRLYHIASQSIWFDEGWSAYAAAQPTLIGAFNADLTNPPLYYLLLNISARFTGDSAFGLRWFSLLFGLLVIPFSYRLAAQLFDRRAALFTALLVACSPLLWWASQEARMYTLLAVLVLLAALGWHGIRQGRGWHAWALLLGAELALLYSHNTGPVIVIWLNGVTLLAWIGSALSPSPLDPLSHKGRGALRVSPQTISHPFAHETETGKDVKGITPPPLLWLAGQVLVGLLWLPWFAARFVQVQTANSALNRPPELGLSLLADIWQAFWAGPWALVGAETLVIVLALLTLAALVTLTPWRKAPARWLLAHVLLLTGGLILGLSVLGNELHGRYLVMLTPLLLVMLGAGLARAGRAGMVVTAVFALLFGGVVILAQNPAYQHDDVRGMVRHYADTLTQGDTVLAWSYADRYDLWYYWDRLGVTAKRVTLPEGADLETIQPLLPESGGVALNIWYTQRADFRGMLSCYTANGTVNPPAIHTVYGMSSQYYARPSLNPITMQSVDAAIMDGGTTLATITQIPNLDTQSTADQQRCLPIDLQLTQATGLDLKAAIIVYNALGQEIARDDAIFATANQRTTSAAQPGETLAAFPLIALPYGAPPGDYRLALRVYDEQANPSGYTFADTGLPELPLGTWTAPPGAYWPPVGRSSNLTPVNIPPLIGHDGIFDHVPEVYNGDTLHFALLWENVDSLPDLTLAGADWSITIPSHFEVNHRITLDWREVRLPLEGISAGLAEWRLPNGRVLGQVQVNIRPALTEPPEYAVEIGTAVGDVGTLVGFTPPAEAVTLDESFTLELIWLADSTPSADYTVFVQLIDQAGRVIAQSDAQPGQGQRPTGGWRPGEYLIDSHTLRFNEDAEPGPARLIAGMYDARTGERLPTSTGDYVLLQDDVTVR